MAKCHLPIAVTPDMLDQTRVGGWLHGHGLLRESKEQLSTVPRGPSIEAERELVQMGLTHGALMGAEQPPFEQGDHGCTRGKHLNASSCCPRSNVTPSRTT